MTFMSTLIPSFSKRRRNRPSLSRQTWRLAEFESRLMLAGDFGAIAGSNNLSSNADIMLYGSNDASSGQGIQFIERLAS